MHRRAPAAGHRDQVTGEPAHRPGQGSVFVEPRDTRPAHPAASAAVDDRMSFQDVQPGTPGVGLFGAFAAGPQVDDRGYLHAMAMEIEGGAVGAVVVGRHHGAAAGKDGKTVDIGARGAGQHHPRTVVVGEDQRPLQRARRQHDAPGADAPQTLARQMRRRGGAEMVGDPFERDQEIVVEIPGDSGPGENPDIVHPAQLRRRLGRPSGAGDAVAAGSLQERAAGRAVLVGENDPGPALPRRQRRGEPGRSGADDENVAMRVPALVAVGIRAVRRLPQTRHPADQAFVEMPAAMRPHEGLVVEAGRDQAVCEIVDGAEIEAGAGPAIDAVCREALIQLDSRGLEIGQAPGPGADLHQRVGLFGAGGQDAARAVVFEAPPHQVHAVGEQGGCQRISGEPFIAPPVEREPDPPRPVDRAAFGQTIRLLRHAPPSGTSPGGGSPMR